MHRFSPHRPHVDDFRRCGRYGGGGTRVLPPLSPRPASPRIIAHPTRRRQIGGIEGRDGRFYLLMALLFADGVARVPTAVGVRHLPPPPPPGQVPLRNHGRGHLPSPPHKGEVFLHAVCRGERKCADTRGTVPVPWAGHFQC